MKINETAQEIFQTNKEKGFWDKERNVGEMLMLVTSELSEALEADRKGIRVTKENINIYETNIRLGGELKANFEAQIKDTFEDELADVCIRIFDMAAGMNIDLEFHIKQKMAYNKTRAKMHGKKY